MEALIEAVDQLEQLPDVRRLVDHLVFTES
jgi:hypothetical protein